MELLTFFPLVFMMRSDFRRRRINSYPLLCFVILVAASSCNIYGVGESWCRVWQNGGILVLLTGGAVVYLIIRSGGRIVIIRKYAGIGDWLFLFCMTPLFAPMEYAWFLVVAFVFSLVWWGIYSGKRGGSYPVPLVSTVGGCYIVYLLFRLFS